jgi:hypothetical protein
MSTAQHLRARLRDCDGQLCSQYADQVLTTGINTTAHDAFSTWHKWLDSQGGTPVKTLRLSDWNDGFHERVAAVIREVSRYPRGA